MQCHLQVLLRVMQFQEQICHLTIVWQTLIDARTSQFFLDRIDINRCTSEFFLNRTHVGSQLYLMGFLDLISKFGLVSFGFSLSPDFNSKYSKYTQDQRVRGIYLFRSAKSEISERWCNSVIGKDRLEMGCSTGKKK